MIARKQIIAIRLRPKTIEELKKIAEEKEMSMSEYIRVVLENHLSSR